MKFRVMLRRSYIRLEVGSIVVEANSKAAARRQAKEMLDDDELEDEAQWHETDGFVNDVKVDEVIPIDDK